MRVVRCDGSPESVTELAGALAEALDGGPAVRPVDSVSRERSAHLTVPPGTALIVETSGSTGGAKLVALSADALRASATATHIRLGDPGRWLLALPAHHIAGVQVIVRSLLAGHPPAMLEHRDGFRLDAFAASARALIEDSPGERHYTALVPTQLYRVLTAADHTASHPGGGTAPGPTRPRSGGQGALDALRRFDAVLVGGATTPPSLLEQARAAGVAVVTTYGMSETAGGCVYDGVPLEGVRVRLAEPDGRIWVTGPTLATGYPGEPELTAEVFAGGWFRTSDLGAWSARSNCASDTRSDTGPAAVLGGPARLRVLGRVDDVITTGGEKVHPAVVERVLTAQPGVRAACVVGLDDPEWGQRVAAAVVPAETTAPDRGLLARAVRGALGRPSVPKRLRVVEELPLRGIGKPDRVAVARMLAERAAHHTVTTVATLGDWVAGARPRTLGSAVSPVLVGLGAAVGAGAVLPARGVLALVVALALVVGVNYANDYSDGIRGADDDRVDDRRLVGSGVATPRSVRAMALAWLGLAVLAGTALVALSRHWWLFAVGAACLVGAWFYTGGRRPYGYRGWGEVAVFLFFGPVAVLGTTYTQSGVPTGMCLAASVGVGLASTAVLVANNLRDIDTDEMAGKRTLAVRLGDRATRRLYILLMTAPFLLSLAAGAVRPVMLLGLAAAPLAYSPVRRVRAGATGRGLVGVLAGTGLTRFVWSAATAVGLALTLVT